jgi:hypothetical protein
MVSAEEIDLADLIDAVAWAAERGEVPFARDWIDGFSEDAQEDPMGHMF